MPDLIIKPENTSGNKLILQDQAGGAVLTTADSGATIEGATIINTSGAITTTGALSSKDITVSGMTGTEKGIFIDQNVNASAIDIDSESTSAQVLRIYDPKTSTGVILYVADEDSLTTGTMASFYSNSADTSARKLVQINNDNAAADGAICLYIKDDGAETPISISNGAHLTSGGAWTNASDRLKKKDITDISYGLAEVLQMQPRSFTWKIDDKDAIGFISQEVELVVPELVNGEDAEEKEVWNEFQEVNETVITEGKGLDYGSLTAVLCKAIQELSAKNDALEARVLALESA